MEREERNERKNKNMGKKLKQVLRVNIQKHKLFLVSICSSEKNIKKFALICFLIFANKYIRMYNKFYNKSIKRRPQRKI